MEGKIYYKISDTLQLSISSGFNRWKEEISPGGNKFQTIPLLAGLKYSFPFGLFAPYFSGELGIHFIIHEYTIETYEMSERFEGVVKLVSSNPETASITKFAYRLSIGSSLTVHRNLDVDLRISYNGISYSFIYVYLPTRQISSGRLYFYSFSVGINYKL